MNIKRIIIRRMTTPKLMEAVKRAEKAGRLKELELLMEVVVDRLDKQVDKLLEEDRNNQFDQWVKNQ